MTDSWHKVPGTARLRLQVCPAFATLAWPCLFQHGGAGHTCALIGVAPLRVTCQEGAGRGGSHTCLDRCAATETNTTGRGAPRPAPSC